MASDSHKHGRCCWFQRFACPRLPTIPDSSSRFDGRTMRVRRSAANTWRELTFRKTSLAGYPLAFSARSSPLPCRGAARKPRFAKAPTVRSQPQLGFSFAICKTKRSRSLSIRGRPTRRRNLDASNLLAVSFRCQTSSVSGFATPANSSKAFRLPPYQFARDRLHRYVLGRPRHQPRTFEIRTCRCTRAVYWYPLHALESLPGASRQVAQGIRCARRCRG